MCRDELTWRQDLPLISELEGWPPLLLLHIPLLKGIWRTSTTKPSIIDEESQWWNNSYNFQMTKTVRRFMSPTSGGFASAANPSECRRQSKLSKPAVGVGRGVGWWSLLVQKSKVQGQFQMRLNSNAQLSVRQEDIFHHLSVSPSALFSFYIKSEMATGTSRLRVHSLGSPGRRENSLSWLVILVPLPLLPSLCG